MKRDFGFRLEAHSTIDLEVVEGDIVKADTDLITNAANTGLIMGDGVAGALLRAGGPEVQDGVIGSAPIELGSAVLGPSGYLPCMGIVHGAVMGEDRQTNDDLIYETTVACLGFLGGGGYDSPDAPPWVHSIALPAFGTGVGGVDLDRCGEMMRYALTDARLGSPSDDDVEWRVVIVLFGDEDYDKFIQGFLG